MLIANSNLVPHWATWDHFNELDRKGLAMYGQMTAGSWIYIGTQGIVQGTYETFVEAGRQHYGGDLKGKLDPHRRPRRHGRRAAARRGDGRRLLPRRRVRRDPRRLPPAHPLRRREDRRSLDEALAMIDRWTRAGEAKSVGADRQRRRGLPRAGAARHPARHRHRPDLGARSGARLPAARLERRRLARPPGDRPEGASSAPPAPA